MSAREVQIKERGLGYPPLEPDEELGSAFKVVAAKLRNLGYYVTFDVLNTADFGVPQTRHRLVIIGSRFSENIVMPAPTHSESGHSGCDTPCRPRSLDGASRPTTD